MSKRFVAIWFRYLKTDHMVKRHPHLEDVPIVLALPDHGRMIITEVNSVAKKHGIEAGMIVADARIIDPAIKVFDDKPELANKLLTKLSHWCIRFTPIAAVHESNALILEVTGCSHLWGSEEDYLRDLIDKLKRLGFNVRAAMADTIGSAWAVCRYGKIKAIIKPNEQAYALMTLPPIALRLDDEILSKLFKLGFYTIGSFIGIQRSVLRRRFGNELLLRLDQALGNEEEFINPVEEAQPYSERLPCMELILTRTGIEIALQKLLEILCTRLQQEGKGLRSAAFKAFRVDDKIEEITVITNHASNTATHLFKLFTPKIDSIEPALGIELFILEANKVEAIDTIQETFWTTNSSLESKEVAELLDRLESKFGHDIVHRYLPDEHHLPEHSIKLSTSLQEKPSIQWPTYNARPVQILEQPQPIEVTAPVPDYPPMNFRYKGRLHKVIKADACERIESEWWLNAGLHRDYYAVEDEAGKRYWVFRSGHYNEEEKPAWFLHGFFA